jgi:hypothetical protein
LSQVLIDVLNKLSCLNVLHTLIVTLVCYYVGMFHEILAGRQPRAGKTKTEIVKLGESWAKDEDESPARGPDSLIIKLYFSHE